MNPEMYHPAPVDSAPRLPRRTILKWFAAAAAMTQIPDLANTVAAAAAPATQGSKGYGTDPDVAGYFQPGDFWPLTFTPAQRQTVTALADVILPADHLGPAASAVGVPDHIDEWVSAPYPVQQQDRAVILPGLQWLETEAQKRFQTDFTTLNAPQKHRLCDDICATASAKPAFQQAAAFFAKFRSLAASAYYGTEAGWNALGYVGNVPLTHLDGPPKEVLDRLGVEQTVK